MPDARILLVDDRPENLIAFEAALEALGHPIVRAASGPEAVRLVLEQEFAVILLDVMMPGMDGLETARLIRGSHLAADTPILFITAMTQDPDSQIQAYASGAVDYLFKPVDLDILRAKVAAYVDLWRKSRAARATSEALHSAVLEASLDAIITIDHEGKIVEWNPAAERIFGYSPADAIGRVMGDLIVPAAQREAHRGGLARYLHSGVAKVLGQRVEMTALRADGTEFPVELAITRIAVAGKPLFAGYVRDNTDRKQAEQALRQQSEALLEADRQKDLYLAMLSHELRNPVGAIGNASYLLGRIGSQGDREANLREIIDRQVRHLARIVDDLLDVSRLTHGLIELRRDWVDLGTVIRDVVETSGPVMEARGHQFTLSLPGKPIVVHADPARIQQIITNLLDNAAKYTPRGGHIYLTVEPAATSAELQGADEPRAVIRIRDTGVGMAPDLLPRVFDIFTQAERSIDRKDGGLGIGLSLVRSLVEMHGGSVHAFSEGPAMGSEFVVYLPIAQSQPQALPSAAPSIAAPRDTGCILVIEDNVDAAVTLAELLGEWGYEVHVAHTGEAGIEAAVLHQPHTLLLDIGLPGIDGYEVARRLRREPACAGVRLMALTGYGKPSDRRCAKEAGIDHHLTKPVDLEALRVLLAQELVH